MANLGRSVGSLETYEPKDKSFSKHVISQGEGDGTPNDGAACTVIISFVDEVELRDGDLGCYKLNETVEVTIGEGDTFLSELLDNALCSMKEKEACYIKCKVDAAGNKVDDVLNKDKQLKFNIILKSFNRAAELKDLEADEKLERAQNHKDKGTELFRAQRIHFAVKRYKKATSIVEAITDATGLPPSLQNQCKVLKCHCYLNLAACHLREERYQEVINYAKHALEVEENNVKGLFRRGQAHLKLHQYPEALADLQKVLTVEPHNKTAQKELAAVQQAMKKEKQMYQKMF